MRLNVLWLSIALLLIAVLINVYRTHTRDTLRSSGFGGLPSAPVDRAGRLLELDLRRSITHAPRPGYPAASAQAGTQGVAVVAVRVAGDGTLQRVGILEAPDEAIANSVVRTVSQWRFKELLPDELKKLVADNKLPPEMKTLPFDSRLTFYFRLVNGDPVVSNPHELDGWSSDVDIATRFTSDADQTNILGQPVGRR